MLLAFSLTQRCCLPAICLMFSQYLTCLYAQEKPSTIVGGIVTVGVIAGLVAYTIYVVLAYINRCVLLSGNRPAWAWVCVASVRTWSRCATEITTPFLVSLP